MFWRRPEVKQDCIKLKQKNQDPGKVSYDAVIYLVFQPLPTIVFE